MKKLQIHARKVPALSFALQKNVKNPVFQAPNLAEFFKHLINPRHVNKSIYFGKLIDEFALRFC